MGGGVATLKRWRGCPPGRAGGGFGAGGAGAPPGGGGGARRRAFAAGPALLALGLLVWVYHNLGPKRLSGVVLGGGGRPRLAPVRQGGAEAVGEGAAGSGASGAERAPELVGSVAEARPAREGAASQRVEAELSGQGQILEEAGTRSDNEGDAEENGAGGSSGIGVGVGQGLGASKMPQRSPVGDLRTPSTPPLEGGGTGVREGGASSRDELQPPLKGGINATPRDSCVEPALPDSHPFHVVVGGHKYLSDEQVAHHYLWDLQIPNMKIIIYRRVRLEKPARRWSGPCGMTAEERLIINRGREASALFDYVLAVRRGDTGLQPPRAFAFVHGHAAIAWHTSCQAMFSRILNFYMQLVQPSTHLEGLERHMMSLTSKASGGLKHIVKLSDHRGLSQGIKGSGEEYLSRTATVFHREETRAKEECFRIFRRHGLDLPYGTKARFRGQSASFVSSWDRFDAAPIGMLEEMLVRFTARNMTDTTFIPELKKDITREYFWSIHCFEFSVYELFPDPPVDLPPLTEQQVRQFYSKKMATQNSFPWPVKKVERMERCKKAAKGCAPRCLMNKESVFPILKKTDERNLAAGLPELAFHPAAAS